MRSPSAWAKRAVWKWKRRRFNSTDMNALEEVIADAVENAVAERIESILRAVAKSRTTRSTLEFKRYA
jgi:hypothetical protein